MDADAVVEPVRTVLAQRVDEEVVLLDVAADRYSALNRTGAALWEQVGDGASVGELARWLAEREGIAPDRALADVARFARDLEQRGFVTARRPAPG